MAKWFNVSKSDFVNSQVQTLVTLEGIEDIDSSESKFITIPIDYKKYELKTVRVVNITNTDNICVTLFDTFDDFDVYRSHAENKVYDILNIPVEDKKSNDDTGNIYLKIDNLSSTTISCEYEIKIVNLN